MSLSLATPKQSGPRASQAPYPRRPGRSPSKDLALNDPHLLTGYEPGSQRLFAAVTTSCPSGATIADRVETALRTALEFLSNDPTLAHLLLVEAQEAGETTAELRDERLCAYADLLRDARLAHPDLTPISPSLSVEKTIVSATASVISKWVAAGDASRLPELLPGLREFTLTAYLGIDQH